MKVEVSGRYGSPLPNGEEVVQRLSTAAILVSRDGGGSGARSSNIRCGSRRNSRFRLSHSLVQFQPTGDPQAIIPSQSDRQQIIYKHDRDLSLKLCFIQDEKSFRSNMRQLRSALAKGMRLSSKGSFHMTIKYQVHLARWDHSSDKEVHRDQGEWCNLLEKNEWQDP